MKVSVLSLRLFIACCGLISVAYLCFKGATEKNPLEKNPYPENPLISTLVPKDLEVKVSFKTKERYYHKSGNNRNFLVQMEDIEIISEDYPHKIYVIDSVLQRLDFAFNKHCGNYFYDSQHNVYFSNWFKKYSYYTIDFKNLVEQVKLPRYQLRNIDFKNRSTSSFEVYKIREVLDCE